jgi:glycosyltransferase involved in cell wall biosynthesis
MSSRKKILWLVSWYPNKLAPFEGDFIQRHARAVALMHDVEVIFVKKDDNKIVTSLEREEVNDSWPGLTERVIYYNPSTTRLKFLNKLISDTAYRYFYRMAILKYYALNGKPDLVHLHVAMKAGLLATWLKRKRGAHYILSEHWTGYLQEAKPNIDDFSSIHKDRWRKIIENANHITTVSAVLGDAIRSKFRIKDYTVVPNVVDTNIFYPISSSNVATTFIHVSSLEEQKNPSTLIEAFSLLKKKRTDFRLIIYGPVNLKIRELAHDNALDQHVVFKDEVPQEQLANDMRIADALVLYSDYETFGCVVIEANACGVPAILSDLAVFREYAVEGKTALFGKRGNPNELSQVLEQFINTRSSFNRQDIANVTKEKFAYDVVARKFDEVYRRVVSDQPTDLGA